MLFFKKGTDPFNAKKKIYSLLVVFFAFVCLYLYSVIFFSSLRYESNHTLFNLKYIQNKPSIELNLSEPVYQVSGFSQMFLSNPQETELYLRANLLDGNQQSGKQLDKLETIYKDLLNTRPSWPYLYSGLLQVNQLRGTADASYLINAIAYGKHETKVIKSLAEILFHKWDVLDKPFKNELLSMLSEQTEARISTVVNIAAKFSRVFEYCDLLYEKKHVEYATCKSQYWQPLSD